MGEVVVTSRSALNLLKSSSSTDPGMKGTSLPNKTIMDEKHKYGPIETFDLKRRIAFFPKIVTFP